MPYVEVAAAVEGRDHRQLGSIHAKELHEVGRVLEPNGTLARDDIDLDELVTGHPQAAGRHHAELIGCENPRRDSCADIDLPDAHLADRIGDDAASSILDAGRKDDIDGGLEKTENLSTLHAFRPAIQQGVEAGCDVHYMQPGL